MVRTRSESRRQKDRSSAVCSGLGLRTGQVRGRSLTAARPGGDLSAHALPAGLDDVAAMTEHLEIRQVVRAGDQSVGADQRLDVVDLELQFMAGIPFALGRVAPDLSGLEAAPLTHPSGAPPRRCAGREPEVIPLELTSMAVAAVRRAAWRQRRAAGRDPTARVGEIHARDCRQPCRCCSADRGRRRRRRPTARRRLPVRVVRTHGTTIAANESVRDHRPVSLARA